jgi:hypothetical protein
MKFTLAIAATVSGLVGSGLVGVVSPAWADTLPPLEIHHSETQISETPIVSDSSSPDASQTTPQHLDRLETQINQDVDGDRQASQPQTPLAGLDEVLDLPEGVVVRGTQRGGLAIGGEF